MKIPYFFKSKIPNSLSQLAGFENFTSTDSSYEYSTTDSQYSSRAALRFGSFYSFVRLGPIFVRLETKPLNSALTADVRIGTWCEDWWEEPRPPPPPSRNDHHR